MGYRNYRCRICGQYISVYTKYADDITQYTPAGTMVARQYHPHCTELEEGEKALCDFVSVSNEPLERSIEVYNEGKI